MDYKLITKHIEPSSEVEERISKKMNKLARFAKWIEHVEIIISGEGGRKTTEINVLMSHKKLNAKSEGSNVAKTVSEAFDKIERQIKKFEEKVTQHHQHHGKI